MNISPEAVFFDEDSLAVSLSDGLKISIHAGVVPAFVARQSLATGTSRVESPRPALGCTG